jgi:hypothetical protein
MSVGLRSVPPRAAGSGERIRRWPDRSTAAVVALALLAVAAGGWLLLSALSAAPGVSAAESAFAARALAINRFGFGAAHLPWYDGGLAALQVAGYETVSGALGRAGSAVGAAREATAVTAVLAAVALTIAARRLALSGPAVVAVAVLFSLAPAALVLHRTADPAQLGVLWACVALAIAGGEAHRVGAAVGSAAYLVAAVVSSPLVLIALVPLFTMLVWTGGLGRYDPLRRVAAAAVGLIVFAGLVVLAAVDQLPGGGVAEAPPVTVVDGLLGLAAVAAGVAGLRVSWLRPLAVALLATVVAAAVAPDLRGSLLLVALPLAAVVLPATVEAALAFAGRRVPSLPRPAVVVPALAAVVLLAWLPAAGGLRGPVDPPARDAVAGAQDWVLTNLPSRPKLVVDDRVWAALVDAGYPAEQLAAVSGLGPDRPAWSWTDAGYAVGRDADLAGAEDPVGAARRGSQPVAAFGTGADRVVVRRVVTDPGAAAAAREEATGRAGAGAGLAANPRLDLSPVAAGLLRGGQVDARVLSVLAAISGEHSLRIADFPVVPGEDPSAPRRLVAVSTIDNRTVTAGAPGVRLLDQWLRAQQPPFRPIAADLARSGGAEVLLVRYDALGSTGLLPP